MAHEAQDLDAAGQPHHLAVSGVAGSIPAELSFHLLHSLDATAAVNNSVTPQSTIDYFLGVGGADPHQPAALQYEPLPPPGGHHQHTMNMLRDYCSNGGGGGHYPTAEPYLRGTRTGALVFGATDDDESAAAYMPGGPFVETSPPPRATGGRKRGRALGGGFHAGLANGVEKKEKQRRQRLTEKYTALMHLIPNVTKVYSVVFEFWLISEQIKIFDDSCISSSVHRSRQFKLIHDSFIFGTDAAW